MKKVMIIGNFNVVMQNIHSALADQFEVQLCPAEVDVVKNMLKMSTPDLIVMSLIDMDEVHRNIFILFCDKYERIPVLSIGKPTELHRFEDLTKTEQFYSLERPVQVTAIFNKVCEILNTSGVSKKTGDVEKGKEGTRVIMIVDDNPVQLRILRLTLSDSFKLLLASSGQDALDKLEEERPDMIFLDYEMPEMDGKETLKRIRQNKKFKDIPVVFLTSVNDRNKIIEVMNLNPAGYLLKPVTQQTIFETVEKLIG